MTVRAFYDLPAPAKINLFLHLVGRRPDGYHLLQSLFVLIDWCDHLHIERRADGQVQRHDRGAVLPADDLCLRAARALQSSSGCAFGADITIDKQVPWGAGMGGGSSDAATTLLALNRLWGLHWPKSRLKEIGLGLGADVPFFIGGDSALVEGIGERLTPMAVAPQTLMVVKPPASIETRRIFASPWLNRKGEPAILAGLSGDSQAIHALIEAGRNDLQAAAEAESAEVSRALAIFREWFGQASMTGSGSAVFARLESPGSGLATGWATEGSAASGRFDCAVADPEKAFAGGQDQKVPAHLFPQQLADGWSGRICSSLPAHPLREWAAD